MAGNQDQQGSITAGYTIRFQLTDEETGLDGAGSRSQNDVASAALADTEDVLPPTQTGETQQGVQAGQEAKIGVIMRVCQHCPWLTIPLGGR